MFTDPESVELFEQFIGGHRINLMVETGTHLGVGALALSRYCNRVVTCEINLEHFAMASDHFRKNGYEELNMSQSFWKGHRMIQISRLNSPEFLQWIISMHSGKFLFYLDAHWGDECPLLDELDVIARHKVSDCLIVIHDFKVPGRMTGYNVTHGQSLDINYVWNRLVKINPDFQITCSKVEPDINQRRGILFAAPLTTFAGSA